jgi:serine/threonine-protein kinase Chk2
LYADDSISQQSQGEQVEPKKPRRSGRNQSPSKDPNAHLKHGQLPSPITQMGSTVTDEGEEGTVTPPSRRTQSTIPSQARSPPAGVHGLSSPPQDTQPFSQFVSNKTYAVDDEEGEGVWGYLVPTDSRSGDVLVLRRRTACPVPQSMVGRTSGRDKVSKKTFQKQEEDYEKEKVEHGVTAGGYLIGRHPECGEFPQCVPSYKSFDK